MTAGTPPVVLLAAVEKTYRTGTQALAPVDLAVRRGEFLTLLGPSAAARPLSST
jgi:ABC-type Fe3+/spermidine/putrescine transport system ATPase subunit